LRKYLIVAVAAFTAIAFAAVSYAQGADTATLKTSLKPVKAGTKKKPKSTTLDLNIVNGNTQRTMSELTVFLPKTLKVSLKGLPKCAPETIFARGCPKSAELGHGDAKAKVGVNGPPANVKDLIFQVTAFRTTSADPDAHEMLGFFIDDGGSFQFLTETTLSKASGKFGQKLNIEVPDLAQHVGGTYNGLVSLHTTLGKKVGKKALMGSTGCKKKKQPFKVVLTFIENQVTRPGTITKSSTAKCKS
jgi:hypothetical protein